jgi:hypothetical protein
MHLPRALQELGLHGPCEADVLAFMSQRPLSAVYRQLVHAHDHGMAEMKLGRYSDSRSKRFIAWVPSTRLEAAARREVKLCAK